MDLLLLANYKDQNFFHGGKIIEGKRGVVYRSVMFLSERWGWNRKKTTAFLRLLKSDGMVTTESTPNGTTITIVNYRKYQDYGTTDGTTNRATTPQQLPNNSPTIGQPLPTYNKYNKDNNIVSTVLEEEEQPDPLPQQLDQIMQFWNTIPHAIPVRYIVPMTRRYDNLRLAMHVVGFDGVMQAIQSVKESEWLAECGHVSFDTWITPDKVTGLIEGRYKEKYSGGGYTGELGIDWEATEHDSYQLSSYAE